MFCLHLRFAVFANNRHDKSYEKNPEPDMCMCARPQATVISTAPNTASQLSWPEEEIGVLPPHPFGPSPVVLEEVAEQWHKVPRRSTLAFLRVFAKRYPGPSVTLALRKRETHRLCISPLGIGAI